MIFHEKGIVLHTHKDSKKDILIKLLVGSGRVVDIRIHGLQVSRTRSPLIAELGSLIDAVWYEKPDQQCSMKEATLIERHDVFKKDYQTISMMTLILEVTKIIAENAQEENIFLILGETLKRGSEVLLLSKENLWSDEQFKFAMNINVTLYFISLFKQIGVAAISSQCPMCGKTYGRSAKWNLPEFHFLCDECEHNANTVDATLLRSILFMQSHAFAENLTRWFKSGGVELWRILESNLEISLLHYIGREIISLNSFRKQLP